MNKESLFKDILLYSFCTFVLTLIISIPELSFAASDDKSAEITKLTRSLCEIVGVLQGNVGAAIGTLAVIFLGIGLFFGKMSWALVIAIAIGIGAIFGATEIVNLISGGKYDCEQFTTSGESGGGS